MGFALSRFSIFQDIAANHKENRAISKFQLCAIILHRSDDHEFAKYLSENMERLNVETGDKFLFIALTQPPQSWCNQINPDYRYQFYVPDTNKPNDTHEELLLTAFLQRLRLEHVQLPGILLTDGLNSRHCIYFETSQKSLSDQLLALGDYCTHQTTKVPLLGNPDLSSLIGKISNYNFDCKNNTQSIAKILAGLTACEDANSDSPLNSYMALDCIERDLKLLQKAIQSERKRAVPDLQEWLNYSNLWALIRSAILQQDTIFHPLAIPDDELLNAGIKKYSLPWYYCQTYNTLLQTGFCTVRPELNRFKKPLMNLNLVMFMEHEANASVIQYIRGKKGIPMPEYYWRFDENRGKVNIRIEYTDQIGQTTIHNVKLNAYREGNIGNLETVTLGHAREVLENVDYFNEDAIQEYIGNLFKFNKLREAHTGKKWVEETHGDIEEANRLFRQYLLTCQPELSRIAEELQTPADFRPEAI